MSDMSEVGGNERIAAETAAVTTLFAFADRRPTYVNNPDALEVIVRNIGTQLLLAVPGLAFLIPAAASCHWDVGTKPKSTNQSVEGPAAYETWVHRDRISNIIGSPSLQLALGNREDGLEVGIRHTAPGERGPNETMITTSQAFSPRMCLRYTVLANDFTSLLVQVASGSREVNLEFDFAQDTQELDEMPALAEHLWPLLSDEAARQAFAEGQIFGVGHHLFWRSIVDVRTTAYIGQA